MIFHTFLFVVAVLLSYVRNGFGIIPVMLDYCAVFKIRFAIGFLSEPAEDSLGCRTESAFPALGREAVLRFGYRSFRICDASGFRAAFAGFPGDVRVRGSRLTVMLPRFPILCCGRFHPVWKMSCRPYPQRSFPQMNNKAQHTKRAPFPTSIKTADFLKFTR